MLTALALLDRVRAKSPRAANFLLSRAVPRIIPSAAGLGLQVEALSDERSQATLPLKRRTKNHVGSVYFGAQMTLMEITMGLVLFRHFPPGPYGMLVKRVESDFHTKAKGGVRAICEPGAELLATFTTALQGPGSKVEGWIPVKLMGDDGSVVSEARFLAALKKF